MFFSKVPMLSRRLVSLNSECYDQSIDTIVPSGLRVSFEDPRVAVQHSHDLNSHLVDNPKAQRARLDRTHYTT